MAWWDFKIFIGVLVSIVVVGFCIIPLIKTICCIWPRVKPGEPISCTKKPCCWYFHFWTNESKYLYLPTLITLLSVPVLFRAVVSGGAEGALAPPEFGSSVNLFQPEGTDYAYHITASTPGFENLTTSLL